MLHESDGVGVELTLDLLGGLDHVKMLKELVKRNHAGLEILDANGSIIIKIESEPALVGRDFEVGVRLVDVIGDLSLSFSQNLDEAGDFV